MPKYRNNLPQLSDKIFLTDGGLETTLIFHDGVDLPYFAAFDLMRSEAGRATLRKYYETYARLAADQGLGLVLETPTWRASPDWAERLGYSPGEIAEVNRASVRLLSEVREAYETPGSPVVISGCLGPRGDGYDPGRMMSADEAETYHSEQVAIFRDSEADMVAAITMTYAEEAIGIARAAAAAGMPVAISFTLETDGRLPTGQDLGDAIAAVDAATDNAPAYFMVNCAHPTHFDHVLARGEPWLARLRGARANASKRSHAELDAAPDLDAGDPVELGRQYRDLRRIVPGLTVLGGCCGTDHRHIEQIGFFCGPAATGTVPLPA